MSIGRSKEERELTSLLASTLVQKEVVEPMNALGWGYGEPPKPNYETTPDGGQPAAGGSTTTGEPDVPQGKGGQPATTPETKAQPVKADATSIEALMAAFESTKDPVTGLYGGKYKTMDEAIKGGRHLAQMANTAFSQRDEMAAKLAALSEENLKLRQTPALTSAAPVVSPNLTAARAAMESAQAAYDKVLSEIAEDGGVLDAEAGKKLARVNRELTQAAADFRVQETFASRESAKEADNRKWDAVAQYMGQNHPDAEKFSEEVALYVRSNTPLAKAIDALNRAEDYIGATELAWVSYRDHAGALTLDQKSAADTSRESELAEREKVRQEQRNAALKDAGVMHSSAGGTGVHQGGEHRGTAEEREALTQRASIEGMAPGSPAARRLREMIIPLPPGLFPN